MIMIDHRGFCCCFFNYEIFLTYKVIGSIHASYKKIKGTLTDSPERIEHYLYFEASHVPSHLIPHFLPLAPYTETHSSK